MKTKEEKNIQRYRQKQDRSSAEALVEAHYREIYAFAYRQTGNMDTAMDLTQDIFLAMLQSIHTYDPEKAAFRTWLYRIASNKIVDFFRSGQYRMAQNSIDPASLVLPAEGTPEEALPPAICGYSAGPGRSCPPSKGTPARRPVRCSCSIDRYGHSTLHSG